MFDVSVFQFIHGLAGQSKFLDFVGIFFAGYLEYILLILALIFVFKTDRRFYRFAFLALAMLLSGGFITQIIRFFYSRPRPFLVLDFDALVGHAATPAFPSMHAALFFSLAFAIWLFNRRWGSWFIVAAILMGLARVFVGVHWPTDIFGGALVALISVLVIKWVMPKAKAALDVR